MSLQDQLTADFYSILADQDGPARIAIVQGRPVSVVVDQPGITGVDPSSSLMLSRMNLYILSSDLGFSPVVGSQVVLDGVKWTVEIPSPHGDGVLQLGLLRYTA